MSVFASLAPSAVRETDTLFFFFAAMPLGMWDLSSLTGDQMEPRTPAEEAWSLGRWTAGEVPYSIPLKQCSVRRAV